MAELLHLGTSYHKYLPKRNASQNYLSKRNEPQTIKKGKKNGKKTEKGAKGMYLCAVENSGLPRHD